MTNIKHLLFVLYVPLVIIMAEENEILNEDAKTSKKSEKTKDLCKHYFSTLKKHVFEKKVAFIFGSFFEKISNLLFRNLFGMRPSPK